MRSNFYDHAEVQPMVLETQKKGWVILIKRKVSRCLHPTGAFELDPEGVQ